MVQPLGKGIGYGDGAKPMRLHLSDRGHFLVNVCREVDPDEGACGLAALIWAFSGGAVAEMQQSAKRFSS